MHSKMLRKCRRIVAITSVSAMIFGSIPVMADSENMQTEVQESAVTNEGGMTLHNQDTMVTVSFHGLDANGESVDIPSVQIESGKSFKEAGISLPIPPKSFGEFVCWEDHLGNVIDENFLFESNMQLNARYDKCIVKFYLYDSQEEAGNAILSDATKYEKILNYGETLILPSELGDYENLVYVHGPEEAGDSVVVNSPSSMFFAWGTKKAVETPKESPVFETSMISWNGKESIYFNVDTKDGFISEFLYNVYTTSSEEPIGSPYAWMEHTNNIDDNGMGKGIIEFTEKLEVFCAKNGIHVEDVEKVEFMLAISYEDGSESVLNRITLPIIVYEPTATLKSNTWTGNNDIVIEIQGKGGKVSLSEMYYYKENVSLGGVQVDADIKVDDNGNGTITIQNEALKKATTFVGEYVKIDWTDVDQLEIDVQFEYQGQNKMKYIYVPIEYKEPVVSETTVLTDSSGKSGVSMNLPAEAPENLSLKVTVSDGSKEKAAISKLIQVDGDKIQTFDLTLFMGDKEWKYNGQFKSTVTLPVPKGWNINSLGLYYFDETTNTATVVPFTVSETNNTLTFETDHFSRYVMIQKSVQQINPVITEKTEVENKPEDTKKPADPVQNVPKTGDETNAAFYIAMMFVMGAVILGYVRKRRVF